MPRYYAFTFEKKGSWVQLLTTKGENGKWTDARTGVTYKTSKEASVDVGRLNVAIAEGLRAGGKL